MSDTVAAPAALPDAPTLAAVLALLPLDLAAGRHLPTQWAATAAALAGDLPTWEAAGGDLAPRQLLTACLAWLRDPNAPAPDPALLTAPPAEMDWRLGQVVTATQFLAQALVPQADGTHRGVRRAVEARGIVRDYRTIPNPAEPWEHPDNHVWLHTPADRIGHESYLR